MIKKKVYRNRKEYQKDATNMRSRGFRSLHQDFVNGLTVTWASGTDQPQPRPIITMTQKEYVTMIARRERVDIS